MFFNTFWLEVLHEYRNVTNFSSLFTQDIQERISRSGTSGVLHRALINACVIRVADRADKYSPNPGNRSSTHFVDTTLQLTAVVTLGFLNFYYFSVSSPSDRCRQRVCSDIAE